MAKKKANNPPVDDRFYFDERAAQVVVRFFERLLRHTRGEWAGKAFTLQRWQRDMLRNLFGWKRKVDGTRRYRKAYVEIPRKNGKSTIAAGIALFLLFADGEQGAEIYSAAADREQAAIVFNEARNMVAGSPELSARSQAYKLSMAVGETNSVYRAISADAHTKHGFNAHGIVIDELHAQPNRDLFDVLTTSVGARRQPLIVMITTAGFDRTSICWEQHEYARQVRDGIIDDPEWFVFIAAADEKDDWLKPETWKKANPSYGSTIKPEYLESEARKAAQTPAYQNTFRRLHLNQWTQQESRWLDINAWDLCGGPVDERLLRGQACYGGLDLASSSDIAAFVLDFPSEHGEDEQHTWLARFWIPEDNMRERVRRDRVPYDAWVRDGLMVATPGNVIDFDRIIADIEAVGELFEVREIAFDRWGAFQISSKLAGAGFQMVGFGQGFASMSHPMKELLRLTLGQRLRHGGNPILKWMADNLVVSQDSAGNIKPEKAKSRHKIDGMVAGVMALDRAMRSKGQSVYEERGIRTL
jgi:phage terminase large subunit-like protein